MWTSKVAIRIAARFRLEDGGNERGANLVEYALLVAMIAVVCIGAVAIIGDQTRDPISVVGTSLN